MHFLGVDIGALTVKVVLIDQARNVVGREVARAGYSGRDTAARMVEELRQRHDIAYTVVTGYGRVTFDLADEELSEISCHAKGAAFLCPKVRTVIDIGGQDSKVIRVLPSGRVSDFAMNDKCAAGTGRFLEVMANALEVDLEELGALSLRSASPVTISSTCTVFAESEAISHMARGAAKEDVAAGLHCAIACRIAGMAARVSPMPEVVFSGGVALNRGVVHALEETLDQKIVVPPEPQLVGALGAALFAWEKAS
jgi:predicted CoA-substrate-specific enzyme activase